MFYYVIISSVLVLQTIIFKIFIRTALKRNNNNSIFVKRLFTMFSWLRRTRCDNGGVRVYVIIYIVGRYNELLLSLKYTRHGRYNNNNSFFLN
jgi:hypothetical protein